MQIAPAQWDAICTLLLTEQTAWLCNLRVALRKLGGEAPPVASERSGYWLNSV